jgi:hypothetical protein
MDKLGLINSSRGFLVESVIYFIIRLRLILQICIYISDVTCNGKKKKFPTKQAPNGSKESS